MSNSVNTLDWKEKLKNAFPNSFVNECGEFIALHFYRNVCVNSYFNLKTVKDEKELKCKVLEWLSRPAFKGFTYGGQHWKQRQIGEEIYEYHLDGINEFLGTNFYIDDIELIYSKLGNNVNRPLCEKFVESGYDLAVLKEKNNETT